jgi:hypothetical protein
MKFRNKPKVGQKWFLKTVDEEDGGVWEETVTLFGEHRNSITGVCNGFIIDSDFNERLYPNWVDLNAFKSRYSYLIKDI